MSGSAHDCAAARRTTAMANLPSALSPSSLHQIEACPLRWSLREAAYPDVWNGRGYPPLVTESQLKGSVVHLVIERITGALRENRVQDLESDVGISVLRQLGGFESLIGDAIGVTLK